MCALTLITTPYASHIDRCEQIDAMIGYTSELQVRTTWPRHRGVVTNIMPRVAHQRQLVPPHTIPRHGVQVHVYVLSKEGRELVLVVPGKTCSPVGHKAVEQGGHVLEKPVGVGHIAVSMLH